MRYGRVPEVVLDGTAGLVALYLAAAIGLLLRGAAAPALPEGVVVEVQGQVARPGLYRVDPPTLAAAVEAAGGPYLKGEGERLTAGDVVLVGPSGPVVLRPTAALASPPSPSTDPAAVVAAEAAGGASAGGGRARPARGPASPVDVNAADAAALEALPGIGPSLARAIVAERAARGPFRRVDELDRVKGIGPATVERLRPFVRAAP